MKTRIRSRLLLGIIIFALTVSGLLGVFIYYQSISIFGEVLSQLPNASAANTDLTFSIKNKIMNAAMIASILILFLILALSFFQVNYLLNSMQILLDEMEKMQERDYHYTIKTNRTDEFGMVVRVLNDMADKINKYRADYKLLSKSKTISQNLKMEKRNFAHYLSNKIKSELKSILLDPAYMDSKIDSKPMGEILNFYLQNLLVNVNDILEFYQIESSKIHFEKKEFNLFQLIETIQKIVTPLALEKNIEFVIETDKRLPKQIIGDPSRTFLILMNLLDNAIKFTKEGSVHLFVRLNNVNSNSVDIDFSIVDTGIGISQDKLNLLFNKNSILYNGYGLRLTLKILEALKSKIYVESQIGIGSNFSFTLHFDTKKEELSAKGAEKSNPPPLSNVKLLLVEDYKLNQIVVEEFLSIWNISVDIADNGKTAVEMVQKNNYSIILMDLQMPVLDGYEAAKMIRNLPDEKCKTIPIIALTASAINDTMKKVKEAGMNGFITKPFRPDELYKVIADYASFT